MTAKLYVVATPLGNLEDISQRALRTLTEVSCIASEDTRHTQALLQHYGISNHCVAYHAFNEKKQLTPFLDRLQSGESVALVSDAGTPLVSDPGFHLIQAAHEAGIEVIAVPGPCAAITALSALAIQEGPFHFEGFLPSKKNQRLKRLDELKSHPESLVFYEAPHRIAALVDDLVACFGEARMAGIGRELTKKFESLYRGSLIELQQQMEKGEIVQKGEFVVVVSGQPESSAWDGDKAQLMKLLLEYLPINKAAKLAAQLTNQDRQGFYQLALALQNKP